MLAGATRHDGMFYVNCECIIQFKNNSFIIQYLLSALDLILNLLNLTENEFFIRKKLARTVVEFAGTSDSGIIVVLFYIWNNSGIVDTTGSITDMMDSKYLSYVTPQQRGNYSALIPGLLDVIISHW